MKKILSLLISLCMVLSLSYCGTSSPKQEAQKEQPQSSQAEQSKDSQENQAQQETPSSKTSLTIGDEAVSGACAIVIDSLRFGKNTDGNKVVVVNYTYKNNLKHCHYENAKLHCHKSSAFFTQKNIQKNFKNLLTFVAT